MMVVAVPTLDLKKQAPQSSKKSHCGSWGVQQNPVRGHKGYLLPTELLSGGSWGTSTPVLLCHWMRQEGLGLCSHTTAPLPSGAATGRNERLRELWLLLVLPDGFAVQ